MLASSVLAETRQKKRGCAKEAKSRALHDDYLNRNILRFHFAPPFNRKTRNAACEFAGTELIRSQDERPRRMRGPFAPNARRSINHESSVN
jgi:hypothetical protein